MPNVIKKKLNIQTQNVSSPTDMIIKTSSYNGVKNFKKVDENLNINITILKWLKEANLSQFLFKTQIKHSDTFAKNTVKLDTIWTNLTYWRQKQAYEELIAEIM